MSKDKVILSPKKSVSHNEDTNGVNKENGEIINISDIEDSLSEPSRKFIKLENDSVNTESADKLEQKRKLLLQLQQQEEEKERLREEQRLKELECEKIKAQLEALE